MPQRRVAHPSAVKTGTIHAAMGTALFSGLTIVAAGALQIGGDPSAAGPTVSVALFDTVTDPEDAPTLKARLNDQSIPDVQIAAMVPVGERPVLDEPSLGVEYSGAAPSTPTNRSKQLAERPLPRMMDQGSGAGAIGVRINGRTVLPGEAFSDVRQMQGLPPAPISGLSESTPFGSVPAIGTDGTAPGDAYARPFENRQNLPAVSIVLGGLGLNYTHTKTAIDELPPEVTLAFSPHARNLQSWIRRARDAGHEVLIEVPLEAMEYGRVQPHPLTLRAELSADQVGTALDKVLATATGYFGVINYQGEKFARDVTLTRSVLDHLGERGLAFIEDGNLARSSFEAAAENRNLRFAKASQVIDTRIDANAMQGRLMALETQAREHGAALGTAMAYPISMDALRDWASGLAERGVILAPASYVTRSENTSAPATAAGAGAGAPLAPIEADWEIVEPQPINRPLLSPLADE